MKTVQTRFGVVAYEERGQGTPIVFLHANPGDHRDFEDILPALSASYRTIAVDWPGYGSSAAFNPPDSASAMRFADVLEDVVANLNLEPAIFIGNSVGGYASARLAITHPEHVLALVLVDTGGFSDDSLLNRLFCRLKGTEWFTRLIETRFTEAYLKRRNALVADTLARAEEGRHIPARVATNAAVWRSFAHPEHDLRTRASSIHAPTLLVWGQYDPVIKLATDGKNAAASIPGARLKVMATGHMPFAEDADGFLRIVEPFLQEVAARVPSYT